MISSLKTPTLETPFSREVGIEIPLICGAMYPCSNPELIAAVSNAGGIGIVQPISLTYVYGYDFREGLRLIKQLTSKPIGMNALIEQSSKRYLDRMARWIDIALEEGIRFFITSLGNPQWVVRRVHPARGLVYHDATERKWGLKGRDSGVDGLIGVNNRAGGHAGQKTEEALFEELSDLGVPVIAAGGVGSESDFIRALQIGYAGVQMGTRFIATEECHASQAYKTAIINASENDIVLTERLTGIPLSVIRTPYVEQTGLHAGVLARWMLRSRKMKHPMRMIYSLMSLWKLKRGFLDKNGANEYWQAGKSVAGINKIESAGTIVKRFGNTVRQYVRDKHDPSNS